MSRAEMWSLTRAIRDHSDLQRAWMAPFLETSGYTPSEIEDVCNELFPEVDRRPYAVPAASNTFIGRGAEVERIRDWFLHANVRLVTLTGHGGMGKTRLAVEVAASLRPYFPDGVVFVPLDSTSDPDLALPTISRHLGLPVPAIPDARPLLERLATRVRDKQMLLILDSFEHLLAAAPMIAALLAAAAQVRMLITSRAALQIRAEQELNVRALTIPDPRTLQSREQLARYDAVMLLVARIQEIDADFDLTDDNAALVAALACRLEGSPLAIELAAARTRYVALAELTSLLQKRLTVLGGGARDLPPHHHTLRAMIDRSYRLLDAGEQELFARLSVFKGTWTNEAAIAVCRPSTSSAVDVEAGIGALLTWNLIVRTDADGRVARFRMLDTLAEYARERLAASDAEAETRRGHAAYYLAVAEKVAPDLIGAAQPQALARLEEDRDNFRAALDWAVEYRRREVALRLASALWRFWQIRGYGQVGRRYLQRVLAIEPAVPDARRAQAMLALAALAHNQGDFAASRAWNRKTLALYRELGDQSGVAITLSELGLTEQTRQRYRRSEVLCRRGLALSRETRDPHGIALASGRLAWTMLFVGNLAEAQALAAESLPLCRQIGDLPHMATALTILGLASFFQGELTAATSFLERSLQFQRDLQNPWGISQNLMHLGWAKLLGPDPCAAASLFHESLAMQPELNDPIVIAYCLEGCGATAVRCFKQPERGVWLGGAADALRQRHGLRRPPGEQAMQDRLVSEARDLLGTTAFEAAWRVGQSISLDQAIADALDGAQ